MEQQKNQRLKVSMNLGLIIGLILVIMAVLVWTTRTGLLGMFRFINWAVMIGAVYYSMKKWRDQYCGGFIQYSQAL